MKFDPEKHHRRSIRLKEYDYSQSGAYFVTICTLNRLCLFGDIIEGHMCLSDAGKMIQTEWLSLPQRFSHIALDEFTVMPNHFHGVIAIINDHPNENDPNTVGAPLVGAPIIIPPNADTEKLTDITQGAGTRPAPTMVGMTTVPLGEIIGAFKSITTVAYIRGVKQHGWAPFPGKLWQRNYYEHVIRDEHDMNRIREYIIYNPAKWQEDNDNPMNWNKKK